MFIILKSIKLGLILLRDNRVVKDSFPAEFVWLVKYRPKVGYPEIVPNVIVLCYIYTFTSFQQLVDGVNSFNILPYSAYNYYNTEFVITSTYSN